MSPWAKTTGGIMIRPPDIPPKSPCFLEVLTAPFDETCKRFF
jgi:hypothetical protein